MGAGRFAIISLDVEPILSGFEFCWEVAPDLVPPAYADAALAGINGLLERSGLTCDQTRVRVVEGAHHAVDSSPMCYTVATSIAFQDAIDRAGMTSDY
ncbi:MULTISPECIES: hypothetical protein [Lysobacteraceae]|uniref:hypothetical protein n=1 Tax=Lysobacteraceae TaxID=32033 RepID=UPI00387EA534